MRPHLLSLLEDGRRRGNETAFVHWRGLRLERWSYTRLAQVASQFARELDERGIVQGDRVIFWAPNSPAWVAAFFGCLLGGAVVVPLDRHSHLDFIQRVQQQVGAKLILISSEEAETNALGIPALLLDDLPELTAGHDPTLPETSAINSHDLIEIIFTSGTTAEPKGVQLTHHNFLANLTPIEQESKKYLRYERIFHPIRFMSLVPLSHIFGQLMGVFIPMLLGGEVYFRNSPNPGEVIEAIRRHRISVLMLVPRMLASLHDWIERESAGRGKSAHFQAKLEQSVGQHFLRRWWTFRDIHRRFGWKFWAFISGGATLDPATEEFWRRVGYAVLQGYGMTETASLISLPHPFKMVNRSIGKPLPGQEVKLDSSGEILIRGSNVTPGYWKGAALHPIDDEGWLHTGDLGEMDAAGNIFFKGRKKDVISLASGMKVFPEDLEAAIMRQPEVKDVVVIGIDGRHGPEPSAVLILRDANAHVSEVIERANLTLAEHQRIRHWSLWPEPDFPRTTTTHKVLKRAILERISATTAKSDSTISAVSGAPPHEGDFLRDQIARISGRTPEEFASTSNLAGDLRLDSLGRVELLSAIEEHYQIDLDEAAINSSTTLADLGKIIQTGGGGVTRRFADPAWAQSWPVTWIRNAVLYTMVLPISHLLCWSRVIGREHLQQLRGPVLFISNHITAIDPALIISALPEPQRHQLAIAMIGEMLSDWRYQSAAHVGWFKWLRQRAQYWLVTALFNVFPLPQQSGFRRSFAFAGESLGRGYNVLVFPEGQRSTIGKMNPFKAGIGLLVTQLDVPVVPVRIDGLYQLKEEGRHFARPGQVTIRFGQPVKFDADRSAASITVELEERVRSG
jgi:long-chain acyl-CoA synthetase